MKKYTGEEVDGIICSLSEKFNNEILALKEQIKLLTEENEKLSSENFDFKRKSEKITDAFVKAEECAVNIHQSAQEKYVLELESLKNFSKKWKTYFSYLTEKYPLYETVKQANDVYLKINALLGNKDAKTTIEKIDSFIPDKMPNGVPFNPQEKINAYISATSENGFNMNDVLNPGELELEDLCKELGVMEEK